MITITGETSHASTSSDERAYYVFDKQKLVNNIVNLRKAFADKYSNFQIAYSFKTNYLKDICTTIAEQGCIAEVVSPYEYQYALALGLFKKSDVVYNGVIPDVVNKFDVLINRGYVNVDSYDEYNAISQKASMQRRCVMLGVRVNFDIGNSYTSRFGVSIDSEEYRMLMASISRDPYVRLAGFHCHIGTSRPPKYWQKKAEIMVERAKIYDVEYIDLGGGMYGPMIEELSSQFDGYAESFDEYAEAVCPLVKSAFPDERVKLIVEPGTALVGNTMRLIAHVTNIKTVRGKTFVTVDTCSNHLGMICECRIIPMHIIRRKEDATVVRVEDACVAGCTCLEFDYIRKSYTGEIAVGDTVEFENVGAYSIGASRQFIVPRPKVITDDGFSERTGRSEEDAYDMFSNYMMYKQ